MKKNHKTLSKQEISLELQKMTLKQILTYSPYSRETRRPIINEKEFITHLYISTVFDKIQKELEETKKEKEVLDDSEVKEQLADINNDSKSYAQLAQNKNLFEDSLEFDNINKTRFVCGYSGSGKSTYLGHLFLTYRQKGYLTHTFDLAACRGTSIRIFRKTYPNKVGDSTLGKMLFTVLDSTIKFINKGKTETLHQYYKRLEAFTEFYNAYIRENNKDFEDYFDFIIDYLKKPDTDRQLKDLQDQLENLFVAELNNSVYSEMSRLDLKFQIKRYLSLFVMLQWAMLDGNKKNDNLCFIAIDSLEHYINNDEVFNSDIKDICHLVDDLLLELGDNYDDWYGEDEFVKHFRFLVAFRDTTFKMLDDRDADDYPKTVIDISHWFDSGEIVKKRIDYFSSRGSVCVRSTIATAIETILEDDLHNYGYLNQITGMHNYNKRRLSEYLCDVMTTYNSTQYLNLYHKSIYYSNEFKNARLSNNIKAMQLYHNLSNMYRRAARDMIVRLLFGAIYDKGYFKDIKTTGLEDGEKGSSYARRILTYINAKKPREFPDEQENYVSFSELLENAFTPEGVEKIDNKLIKDIAEVIFHMSNSSKDATHWCQLVVVKFNEQKYDEIILKNKMCELYQKRDENESKNYGIKVTQAGRFFLKKMADFEYFLCRYMPQSNSLFDEVNLKKSSNGSVKCLLVIDQIYQAAIGCLSSVKSYTDDPFFSVNGLNYANMHSLNIGEKKGYLYVNEYGNEQTHIERVLNNHISYLDYYRNYIINLYYDEAGREKLNYTKSDFENLSQNILFYIKNYVSVLKQYVNQKADPNGIFYIGGRRDGDKTGKKYYSGYEQNIEIAENNLLQYVWIKREYKGE